MFFFSGNDHLERKHIFILLSFVFGSRIIKSEDENWCVHALVWRARSQRPRFSGRQASSSSRFLSRQAPGREAARHLGCGVAACISQIKARPPFPSLSSSASTMFKLWGTPPSSGTSPTPPFACFGAENGLPSAFVRLLSEAVLSEIPSREPKEQENERRYLAPTSLRTETADYALSATQLTTVIFVS